MKKFMKKPIETLPQNKIQKNPSIPYLMQKSIELKKGNLGPNGEFVTLTGKHTGRSANDKYVVKNSETEKDIWWENNIHPMRDETFTLLKNDVTAYLADQNTIFQSNRSIGNIDHSLINIDLISSEPNAIHFSYYMFKDFNSNAESEFTILHAPDFPLDPKKYNTQTGTVITTSFKEKMTIIIGTHYAGEIKKSMFSIMNYILPKKGILPMHSGACANKKGDSFVFFGLSGTGKTTLSTDVETSLIGDDEHGMSDLGIFNFENGCYAKTSKLSINTEPEIFNASTQFSSYLENVKMNPEQSAIDFFDDSLTENGRSSYPLTFIPNRIKSGTGTIPKDIFFLSADAFGVLPPIAKLTSTDAKKFFVLGYTAKLAGTEIGIKGPKAAFSACFGAPFMLLHPNVYAELLADYIAKYKINVWLINTGWYGGAFGIGQRFPLSITRDIIRAVQNGELINSEFEKDDIFGFEIPKKIREISQSILFPKKAFKDSTNYENEALALKTKFEEQLTHF
jgi:phosphoenolpyruvate carboxykinase (ATP)